MEARGRTTDTSVRQPVLCIVGPTATGKSALAVRVAKAVGGEVLSADSMQVYRGMDIGTAKLTAEEMQGVPHHLMDLVDPKEPFTVADWTRAADEVIARLHALGRLPVVVGGTGLYIRAIVEDLDFAEQPGSAAARAHWQRFLEEYGTAALHAALRARDPVRASRLHPNDVRRVIRALEVFETGRRRMASTYDWTIRGGRYDTVQFGLTLDRDLLYKRIDDRVRCMVQRGLYEEVRRLAAEGCDEHMTSMQAIGYKEMLQAVRGEITVAAAAEEIARATRRFAKRQLSWFRRDPRVRWMRWDAPAPERELSECEILRTAAQLAAGIRR
ncbi:MAG: tRNA (adenosine(37)-N6)-dimethylallyltransferase MiaA [Alicyclobacillus sp.]|nr:tRNA (adenosine(37)-N6)-dimethylallyltransferase MiaA [Alicyclobacillus sp.]